MRLSTTIKQIQACSFGFRYMQSCKLRKLNLLTKNKEKTINT